MNAEFSRRTPVPGVGRIDGLDALRGIAALGVVLLHFTTDFQREFQPSRAASLAFPWGVYGVNLFFLISGFVIFMTVERTQQPADFLISRVSRLYPAFWVAVMLTAATLLLAPLTETLSNQKLLTRTAINLTMFESWFGVGHLDSVYWTLQVEWAFYLVMLLVIWRGRVDQALNVLTALVALALVDHLLIPRPVPAWYRPVQQLLFLEHAYLFTAGVVLYQARLGWRPRHLSILGLCLASPASAGYFPNNPLKDTLTSALLMALVYLTCSGRLNLLANRPLIYLGRISYSLYLTHHVMGLALLRRLDRLGVQPDFALGATLGCCLVLAALLRRWVEQPSMNWMRTQVTFRLRPSTDQPRPTVPRAGLTFRPEVIPQAGV